MKVGDTLYSIRKHNDGTTTYFTEGSDVEYKSLDDKVEGAKPQAKVVTSASKKSTGFDIKE